MATINGSDLQGSTGLYLQSGPSTVQGGSNTIQLTAPGSQIQPAGGATGILGDTAPAATTAAPPKAPAVDPWAGTPWGSQANYNKALDDFNASKSNAFNNVTDATNNAAVQYGGGINDFIDQLRAGQRNIDRGSVQNELSRDQGRLGVLDMVGSGIRSGGVVLNNANAANSSAGDALGRAYSDMGRRELTKVGSQYALGQENIHNQQQDLGINSDIFRRKSEESKITSVNAIVQTAAQQLQQLNIAAQYASLPDRIAIEQEKARIRTEATNKLSSYDSVLSNGIASVAPRSAEGNRTEAQRLLTAGTAPDNSFNYTSDIPTVLQNTGPFASSLPIFTGKRRDLASAGA